MRSSVHFGVGSLLFVVLAEGGMVSGCGGSDVNFDDNPVGETGGEGGDLDTSTGGGDAPSDETSPLDETGTDAPVLESGSTETPGDADDTADDSASGDTSPPDTLVVEIGGDTFSCGTLSPTVLDVYVDKSTLLPSVGTPVCPFKTIVEATSLPAVLGRIIHVKGGASAASPFDYAETSPVVVKSGIILKGDGSATTQISSGGSCVGGKCTVQLNTGGVVEGFSITSASDFGVIMPATDGATPGVLTKSTVSGCGLSGIMTLGPATLGPFLQSSRNKGNGVVATGPNTLTVGGGSSFDSNGADGIHIEGGSVSLKFGGGTASNNGGHGIVLGNKGSHTISALTAKGNGVGSSFVIDRSGIRVFANSSLFLRDSVLLGNGGSGLVFSYQVSASTPNTLDIGTKGSLGNNTFSEPTLVNRNRKAGLCLEFSGSTASEPAQGNKWAACGGGNPAVSETAIFAGIASSACATSFLGLEIAYQSSASGGPDPVIVSPSACSVGP